MTRIEQFKQALLHQTQRNHEFSVLCDGCNLAAVLLDEPAVAIEERTRQDGEKGEGA